MASIQIERAGPADAVGIVRVLEAVVAERIFSAIDTVWPVEQEASYLAALSPREAFHVARDHAAGIIGFQSLDLWSTLLPSMAHVGQIGTFLLPHWRGLGVGRQLWDATETFADQAGYEKLAIQVRASNIGAQRFYRSLGFKECGRLTRQVRIDGISDDEVLMELFLRADSGSSDRRSGATPIWRSGPVHRAG
jgi:ribosomal protein S18 acetylase RimI-like enzyme